MDAQRLWRSRRQGGGGGEEAGESKGEEAAQGVSLSVCVGSGCAGISVVACSEAVGEQEAGGWGEEAVTARGEEAAPGLFFVCVGSGWVGG